MPAPLPGEFELIARLAARLGSAAAPGVVGIGDDCAAVPLGAGVMLLTCDAAVAGRHFTTGLTPLETVGWRVATANVSDVAACGGVPRWALVSLVVPEGLETAALETLYAGLREAGEYYGFTVLGGNISGGAELVVDVFMVGEAPRFIARSGARPGDLLAVSGPLGGAEAGRLAFEGAGGRLERLSEWERGWVPFYLRPRARTDLVPLLQQTASAAIDISDGLASELGHLAKAGGVGLEVLSALVPLAPGLGARAHGRDPLTLALRSGEEYQVLFTVAPEHRAGVEQAGAVIIGQVTREPGVRLDGQPLPTLGWDHLRR